MHAPIQATSSSKTAGLAIDPSERTIGLRNLVDFLRSSYRTIASTTAIFVVSTAIYLVSATPVFLAASEVLIDSNKAQLVFAQDGQWSDMASDQARVESQMAVIRSDRVANAVIRNLNLLEEREFADAGTPLAGIVYSWLGAWFGPDGKSDDRTNASLIAARFEDRVSVRRVGQSLVIEIGFRAADPERAAKIANAIAVEYIKQNVDAKSQLAQRRSNWLSERLAELQRQSFDAARAVEQFKYVGDKAPSADVQAKLAELESVAQGYRRMYEAFQQQLTETLQRVSFPESDARVVSNASPPLRKSYPKSTLVLGFAILLGAGAGAAISLMRGALDRRIRTPERLISETGLECLGSVSRLRSRRRCPVIGKVKNAIQQRQSEFFLDIRNVKTSVQAMLLGRSPGARAPCIGVLASRGGHGTTTIATALAFASAASRARTLLIDACDRNPTISHELVPGTKLGLVELLEGADACSGIVAEPSDGCLAILPVGGSTASVTPADLIGAAESSACLNDIKKSFDLIIIDLPDLCSSPDGRAFAPHLDGIVLVADDQKATLDDVLAAASLLGASRANVLGLVLNRAASRKC